MKNDVLSLQTIRDKCGKARVHNPAQNLRFGLGFPMGWFCRIIHAFTLIFRDGDALISIFRYIRSNYI